MNKSALDRFRDKLSQQQAVYGLWVTLESPTITEIAVALGLDWVVIDAEHGHLDWKEIIEHIRCTARSNTIALVRLSDNHAALIKRALDIGADGVVIPWMEDPPQLERAIAASKYPPNGIRGIGAERATCWGQCFPEHVAETQSGPLVVPIIESVKGVQNVQQLARVDGVEVFFFGPADLSATAGFPGEWEGGNVGEMILQSKDALRAAGKHCGIVARNSADMTTRHKQGFRMLCHGLDAGLLIQRLQASMEDTGAHPKLRPGFTLENDEEAVARERPVCATPNFKPDRMEVMIPANSGPSINLSPGVDFICHVGSHNQAKNLTVGLVTMKPQRKLPYHSHAFGETITLLSGELTVEVEGRIYKLSSLDNVSIPAGLAHKAFNPSRHEDCLLHVAMASSTPDRMWVDGPHSKRGMPSDTTQTVRGGERFTSFAHAEHYSPGLDASFVDYFNAELIPGYEMSGGYGIFQPGGRLPAHLHDFDESIFIAQGTATCLVEGRSYTMNPHGNALQPRGRIHYFVNRSNEPMAMIWVYAGPMPERLVVDEACAVTKGVAWG